MKHYIYTLHSLSLFIQFVGIIIFSVPELASTLESSEQEFMRKFGISKPQKSDKLAISCRSGKRVVKAEETLKTELGFVNTVSYSGSFNDWKEKGGPIDGGNTSS